MNGAAGPAIDYRQLRPAIEVAVAAARRWRRARTGPVIPQALLPHLAGDRVPSAALGRLGRAVDADDEFRLAVAASLADGTDDLLDDASRLWLTRPGGWRGQLDELLRERRRAATAATQETAERKERRRRIAAEDALAASREEVAALGARLAALQGELAAANARADEHAALADELRAELTDARRDRRHADDRRRTASERVEALRVERDAARATAQRAERSRDELLAARAAGEQGWGRERATENLAALRELARRASTLAAGLAELVTPEELRRQPVAIPGAAAASPVATARHLLGVDGVVVFIDGYNVAKLEWPHESLERQRQRLLDLVDTLARRFPAELVVVFDGADVIGAHSAVRRLARVRYSPAGVTADDEIRALVATTDVRRAVVVVTNDKAIRRDVAAVGTNLLASETLTELALG